MERALKKRAPFHHNKNSVADALIVEMYVEVLAADGSGKDDHCFVTSNTKDFSQANGDTRLPHANIAAYFATPRSGYFTSLATAVAAYFPEDARELMADLVYYDEPRSLQRDPALDRQVVRPGLVQPAQESRVRDRRR